MGLDCDPRTAIKEMKTISLRRANLTTEELEEKIQQRLHARSEKDFETADRIRTELETKGILLMDTPNGTNWRPL